MIRFLKAAFHITVFQVLLVLCLSGLKYWIGFDYIIQHHELALLIMGIAAVTLFITAIGVEGNLENKGYAVDDWVAARPDSWIRVWIARFTILGKVLPIALGYSFALFMILPTSLTLFIVFFAGIVLRNIIIYLTQNKGLKSGTPPDAVK